MPDPDVPDLAAAVIGSGPSGFYTTAALLGLPDRNVRVDMFERLPTPWGLVRAGVAPDHPKIKSIAALFARTATHERFRFFGNVEVGTHVGRADLLARYDVVVYCVGAPADRSLGIPGEGLPGVVGAGDFVGWYNGQPDFRDVPVDVGTDRAVVVGNGNVALDVARVLATPPDRLAATDIADHALDTLRGSRIREVVVVGRRGPGQAAFTSPELRELAELTGAAVVVDPAQLADVDETRLPHVPRHNLQILRDYAAVRPVNGGRRVVLRFFTAPIEVRGRERVESIVLGRTVLDADGRVVDTGDREVLPAGLVLRAVGYRGVALPGVPFDEVAGVIPNRGGRVTGGEREYVAGWIKRGPTGIIGSNKKDAVDTVHTIVDDLADPLATGLRASRAADPAAVESWLRERRPEVIDLAGWAAIDAAEQAAGEQQGRPRVKLCTWADLLAVARSVGV
ncbi:NADP oxidoreductase [Nakamurella sp.]|uniref:NADP oxidoreductase n=1 Tax=Nakamurella sp. TaxID=1869182 RepID=UPI003B3B2132